MRNFMKALSHSTWECFVWRYLVVILEYSHHVILIKHAEYLRLVNISMEYKTILELAMEFKSEKA